MRTSLNKEPAAAARRDAPPPRPSTGCREIVLVGHPNVGKSVLFGLLTGRYVTVSNYPGTTVEISRGRTVIQGERYRVCDTPGVHSLHPLSEDERVTRDILMGAGDAVVVQVADAKNLDWELQLTLQLMELRVPMVLCLNMVDEAEERGIGIDPAGLEARLGIPVVRMVAVRRRGLRGLLAAIGRAGRGARVPVRYDESIETACSEVVGLLPRSGLSRRGVALMLLSGDDTLREWLRGRVAPERLDRLADLARRLEGRFGEPVACRLDRVRIAAGSSIAAAVRQTRRRRPGRRWLSRIEPWTVHPVGGVPILAAVLLLVYLFVGRFGAGFTVDWIEGTLFGRWINPVATRFVEAWIPFAVVRDFLVGPYGLITMALTYSIAIVLPIVGTFFIAFGILEDSGYLPRLAAMLNRIFRAMGLNGKAVLPMVLGLGCDTMATLTTRVLETWKERATVIVLLAVGVPCSAQLAVIFAMLGSVSLAALLIWGAVVAGIVFLVGALASRVLPGSGSDFVLELPPLRAPRIGNLAVKTVARIEWYLREAVPLFLAGTAALFVLDRIGLLARLRDWSAPVVVRLLGLPAEAGEAFLLGFLRRDFGAAGLFYLQEQGRLDPVQVLVSVVTLTLFLPCIAHFLMIVKEKNFRFALALMAFTILLAVGVGAGLNLVLRFLEVPLG